jgi:hypothetical protein
MLRSEILPVSVPVKTFSKHLKKRVSMVKGTVFRNYPAASKSVVNIQ